MSTATNGRVRRFIGSFTCPICKGSDDDARGQNKRCYGFLGSDGKYAHCTRDELAGTIPIEPNSQTFAHKLTGKCACGEEHGQAEPQRAKREIVAAYDYHDRDGALLFQAVRYRPKNFRQRRPDGKGGWIANLTGIKTVLYRLPEWLADDPTQWAFIVEGEKDVDRLRKFGLPATCNPMGAGKWRAVYAKDCRGRRIIVIPDNDDVGRKHADRVALSMIGAGCEVRVLELPGLAEHGDVSDWLDRGGTLAELRRLADGAPAWSPRRPEPSAASNGAGHHGGDGQPKAAEAEEDPADHETADDPHRLARIFIRENFTHADGPTLAYHRDTAYRWDGLAYRIYMDAAPDFTASIKEEFDRAWAREYRAWKLSNSDDDPPKVRKVTTSILKNALQALNSETVLSWDASPPCWIDDRDVERPDPFNILPARNGLVDLATLKIMLPTPRYFTPFSLDYDFIADAPDPVLFLKFLRQLWPDDDQSIRELQKWFGYLLTPDTSQEKILLVVGPPRAGKGTLARILTRLLGAHNVDNPSLAQLARNFGLWSLVDKTAAIFGDASLSGTAADKSLIVERLKGISGRDDLTIDRKYQKPLTTKLMTRLTIFANEEPNFRDPSGALASRFIPLRLTQTWLGKEDKALASKLYRELPGILLWAIEGRKFLDEDRGFDVPESSEDMLDSMKKLMSPISMFASECLEIIAPDTRDARDLDPIRDIFHAYDVWCRETKHESGSENIFGRNLQSAFPHIKGDRPRDGTAERPRRYRGVKLNAEGRDFRNRWSGPQ